MQIGVRILAKRGTTKFRSNLQEKQVAEELNGRVQIASGALDDKADVRTDKFLVECKTTEKFYYALSANIWNKVYKEANKLGLCPVMCVHTNDTDSIYSADRYCILRKEDFDYFLFSSETSEDLIPNSECSTIKLETKKFNKQIFTCHSDENIYIELSSDRFAKGVTSLVVFPWSHFLNMISSLK